MRSHLTLLATVAAVLCLAACGGGEKGGDDGDDSALKFQGDQRGAAQVVEDFGTAIRDRDWKRICNDLYTPKERDLQKGLVAKSCEDEVDRYADLKDLSLTVTRAEVTTSATVSTTTATSGEANFDLKKQGGAWHIDGTSGDFTASGGEPSASPPPGTGDQAAAGQTVLDFDQALADRDFDAVCALYTANLRMQAIGDCPDSVGDMFGHGALGLTVERVDAKTEADVAIRTGAGDGGTFTLRRDGGRWRIDAFGGTLGNS